MEFETHVENELIKLGYPIFYRNLRILCNDDEITEFDIISTNFIVEVKSGNLGKMKGFNLVYRHSLLPENFIYFVYCPMVSDEELKRFQEQYDKPSFVFIKSLSDITNYVRPIKNINITNETALLKFLKLSYECLQSFNTIYIPKEIYDSVCKKLINDQSTRKLKKRLWNLETLKQNNKVSFNNPNSDDTFRMINNSNIITIKNISSIDRLTIDLYYTMYNIRKIVSISKPHLKPSTE